jgi:ABC-type phosphate/phosphonate transport system ATPase subunit
MVFGSIASSPLGSLNPKQALQLANLYLDNAYNTNDPAITLVLCHDTEISLSHARKVVKHAKNTVVVEGMATTYIDLGKLLEKHGHDFQAQTSYKKAAKLG